MISVGKKSGVDLILPEERGEKEVQIEGEVYVHTYL